MSESKIQFEEIEGETELAPVDLYAPFLIAWAAEQGASDLFISDDENSVAVSMRIMGSVRIVRRLARHYGNQLQGHLRAISDAAAGNVVHPVEGRGSTVADDGKPIDFRLSALPTHYGQDVSIRLFDPTRFQSGLGALGFDDHELEDLQQILTEPHGLILVSGPVASGKTSTLYAALKHINDGTRKIHTIEDPIEHPLRGVNQTQVNLRAKLDFSELLSAVLRHSPDVVMIGEIRDHQTANTAVRAASSGQLVLATVHADSCAQAISVMRQYHVNPAFLGSTLVAVINQRLFRRLDEASAEEIASGDDLTTNQRVRERLAGMSPRLCREGDGGFASLTCLPELMRHSHDLEQAIINGAPTNQLETIAVQSGMLTLVEAAELRILRGQTTAIEMCRLLDAPHFAPLLARYRQDG